MWVWGLNTAELGPDCLGRIKVLAKVEFSSDAKLGTDLLPNSLRLLNLFPCHYRIHGNPLLQSQQERERKGLQCESTGKMNLHNLTQSRECTPSSATVHWLEARGPTYTQGEGIICGCEHSEAEFMGATIKLLCFSQYLPSPKNLRVWLRSYRSKYL